MRRMWLALLAALALTLAACGEEGAGEAADETGDAGEQETAEAEDTGDDEPAEDDAAEDTGDEEMGDDAPAEDATIRVESTELGDVIVDAEGMTLYLFQSDSDGESTCYDDCEANWPPLIDEQPVAGEGLDESLLGTHERDDGSVQVTYNDWPLYYWAADSEPGDVDGQGVGDVWWVVDPSGEPITDADEADAGGGSGY